MASILKWKNLKNACKNANPDTALPANWPNLHFSESEKINTECDGTRLNFDSKTSTRSHAHNWDIGIEQEKVNPPKAIRMYEKFIWHFFKTP